MPAIWCVLRRLIRAFTLLLAGDRAAAMAGVLALEVGYADLMVPPLAVGRAIHLVQTLCVTHAALLVHAAALVPAGYMARACPVCPA